MSRHFQQFPAISRYSQPYLAILAISRNIQSFLVISSHSSHCQPFSAILAISVISSNFQPFQPSLAKFSQAYPSLASQAQVQDSQVYNVERMPQGRPEDAQRTPQGRPKGFFLGVLSKSKSTERYRKVLEIPKNIFVRFQPFPVETEDALVQDTASMPQRGSNNALKDAQR